MGTRTEYIPPVTIEVQAQQTKVGDIIWNQARGEFDHVLAVTNVLDEQTKAVVGVRIDMAYETTLNNPTDVVTIVTQRSYNKVVR